MSVKLFDAGFYAGGNPDLIAAGLTTEKQLFNHFQKFGLNEGRGFSPLVDLKFYQSNNPDLANFNNQQLWEHLQSYGIAEGRLCSLVVDLDFYRRQNSDLANFSNEELLNHLQTDGIKEGRVFSPFVDLNFYLANHPDVNRAFDGDRSKALQHLQLNGFFENRNCSPAFKFDPQLNCFVSVDANNSVIDWNNIVLNAIKTDRTPPPLAARNMAMVHTAIYDAVNAIAQTYTPYQIAVPTPNFASPDAAAAAAAHRILVNLYPQQTAKFDSALTSSLAKIPDGQFEDNGVILGQWVADSILFWRSTDGATAKLIYTPFNNIGDWQPTPPYFQAALLPQWPKVTPFAMTSPSQFRPVGPPALDSAEYAAEFNQVKELGRKDSLIRTPEQTEIALFWADGPGTFTPPGHWNAIAQNISLSRGNTLLEDARLFALLNIALADAGIAAWDAKYVYNFWRPITAIHQADWDNNPLTIADLTWDSLIESPPFPDYVSGHSTFSGAADAVLTYLLGDNVSFTDTTLGFIGASPRSFNSFSEAANEAGMSRIYGGIHYQSANEDGLAMGRSLGNFVVQNFLISQL